MHYLLYGVYFLPFMCGFGRILPGYSGLASRGAPPHDGGMNNTPNPEPNLLILVPVTVPARVRGVLVRELARHGVNAAVLDDETPAPPDIRVVDVRGMLSAPVRLGRLIDVVRDDAGQNRAMPPRIDLGPFVFLPRDFCLHTNDEQTIRLTEKERDLLLLLVQAGGAYVGRDELLDRVWGFVPGVETHTVETHIYRLRQKIECDPSIPQILQTDGDGYRLALSD